MKKYLVLVALSGLFLVSFNPPSLVNAKRLEDKVIQSRDQLVNFEYKTSNPVKNFGGKDEIVIDNIVIDEDLYLEVNRFSKKDTTSLDNWIESHYPLNKWRRTNQKIAESSLISESGFTIGEFQVFGEDYIGIFKELSDSYFNLLVKKSREVQEEKLRSITSSLQYRGKLIFNETFVDKIVLLSKESNSITKDKIMESPNYSITSRVSNVTYKLPWQKDISYSVTQDWSVGENCNISNPPSHCGTNMEYAYDFGIPKGEDVVTSASGEVSHISTGNNICGGMPYVSNANYVVVKHQDGTSTLYLHLNAVDVSVGQKVIGGQKIGTAGDTGYTNCNTHLHFQRGNSSDYTYWTQSESIYFDEYPDLELNYDNYYTSQNVMLPSVNICYDENTVYVNSEVTNYNCGPTESITLGVNTRILPDSRLYIR